MQQPENDLRLCSWHAPSFEAPSVDFVDFSILHLFVKFRFLLVFSHPKVTVSHTKRIFLCPEVWGISWQRYRAPPYFTIIFFPLNVCSSTWGGWGWEYVGGRWVGRVKSLNNILSFSSLHTLSRHLSHLGARAFNRCLLHHFAFPSKRGFAFGVLYTFTQTLNKNKKHCSL